MTLKSQKEQFKRRSQRFSKEKLSP